MAFGLCSLGTIALIINTDVVYIKIQYTNQCIGNHVGWIGIYIIYKYNTGIIHNKKNKNMY